MNTRRTMALARANIKRNLREPSYMFLLIAFPVALTVLFGVAFGAIGSSTTTYSVGVVNLDHAGADQHWSEDLIGNLSATQILSVQTYADNATAQSDLSQGRLQAVIVIPQGFGAACAAYAAHPDDPGAWTALSVGLYLDPASMVSIQAVPAIAQQALAATLYGTAPQSVAPIGFASTTVASSTHLTSFDYMAPGVVTFAAVFVTMVVGQSFAIDREKGLLRRFSTTPITPAEFIGSHVLSNMVLAVVQLAIVFALIMALGFHSSATVGGIAVAFVLVLLFSVCSVGFGLITASVAKNPGQATMVAFAFIMPQMFLGTFMGASLSSSAQAVGAVLPAYYVTDGLNTILLRGASLASQSILVDVAAVACFAVAVLVVGTMVFRRYGSR